jgi:chromosome segregation ATPase
MAKRHDAPVMKLKIAIVILFLVCVGLGLMLVFRQKENQEQGKLIETNMTMVVALSNDLKTTTVKLDEANNVNISLKNLLEGKEKDLVKLTNDITTLRNALTATEAGAKANDQALRAAMAVKDSKINELEGKNDAMSRRLGELTNMIAALQKQIADTELNLGKSESDREFLLAELKRLQTEKADLERQFRDIEIVKAQLAELKKELAIANRLAIARSGFTTIFSGKKGAEMLVSRPSSSATNREDPYRLDVTIRKDGAAVNSTTNSTLRPN